jgi:iron complex outermembrane receptor protein
MWFAGLNRGVKGGSYNAMLPDGTPPLTNAEIPYEPEELYTLEVGFKSTLVDGTVFFNGSAFVYDYKDYQAFTFRNVSGQVTNNDASNAGIEFDISARPTDRFSMSVGVSFFDAKVEDLAITPTLVRDVEPTFAPKTQVAAQFSYEWPTPGLGDGSITLGLNANYNADFWHNLRNFDADKLPSYTVVDARLNWKSGDERWSVTGFLSNAFDERYRNIGFNLATICGCNEESYGKPRWWGLTMRYNFTK